MGSSVVVLIEQEEGERVDGRRGLECRRDDLGFTSERVLKKRNRRVSYLARSLEGQGEESKLTFNAFVLRRCSHSSLPALSVPTDVAVLLPRISALHQLPTAPGRCWTPLIELASASVQV
jgi:hypothetical protein